jgi:hypothetical protein
LWADFTVVSAHNIFLQKNITKCEKKGVGVIGSLKIL